MKIRIIILVSMLISGCGGYGYYLSNYNSLKQNESSINGRSYLIFDRSEVNMLYIRPSVSDAFGHGQLMSNDREGMIYEMKLAANKYLETTGKKECMFDKGKEIMNGQFEFNYKCKSK